MINPTTVSMIRDIVAIFGVMAGFTYYVLTVRNAQRTRELTLKAQENALETRQTQLFMNIYQTFQNKDFQQDYLETIYERHWEDYEDFMTKYGTGSGSEVSVRMSIFNLENFFEGLGVLVYRNQIDISLIDDLMRSYVVNFWEKWRTVAFGARDDMNPFVAEWTEYLYNELMKIESIPAYQR
jgi:hypothetical protein